MVVTFNPAISSRPSFTSNNKNVKPARTSVVAKPAVQEYKAGKTVANGIAHKARTMFLGLASLAGVAGLSHSCTMDQYSDALNNPVPNKINALAPDSVATTPARIFSGYKTYINVLDSLGARPVSEMGKEFSYYETFNKETGMIEQMTPVGGESCDTCFRMHVKAFPKEMPDYASYSVVDIVPVGYNKYRKEEYIADETFNIIDNEAMKDTFELKTSKAGLVRYHVSTPVYKYTNGGQVGLLDETNLLSSKENPVQKIEVVKFVSDTSTGLTNPKVDHVQAKSSIIYNAGEAVGNAVTKIGKTVVRDLR